MLILASSPAAAHAGDPPWASVRCTPLATLDAAIRYCTDNVQASVSAQACSAQIDRAWASAAVDLAVLEGEGSGQRLDFGRSQERYDLAAERLESLIALTKKNADLLAAYPKAMVDNPSMESFDESLPCFRDVYDQLQLAVTKLDRKAREGRTVLAGARRLRASAQRLAAAARSGATNPLVPGIAGSTAEARLPAAVRRPAVSSDITGVHPHGGDND
jgi:hypothetical protein